MWLLRLILFLEVILIIKAEFGTPYLKKSRVCTPWNCVARHLGLPASLPSQNNYTNILKTLLPEEWHQAIDITVQTCYNNRQRQYVNTCTGQALLHCTLDNLVENCPVNSTSEDDACNPVSTTAGMSYMFTQSRYKDMEKNLGKERRPPWFMRQFFDRKCCDVPRLINYTVLSECGFSSFLRYYENGPDTNETLKYYLVTSKPKSVAEEMLKVMPIREENFEDPLECCDVESFIASSWRSKCGFQLTWDGVKRFKIKDQDLAPTTLAPETTTSIPINKDIKVVPLSCDKEICIFQKLKVITESGTVDMDAYSKVLDNFTTLHPSWSKAKARVITQCLTRKNNDYSAECEINELLGCTLDVFSENCPHRSKNDDCRHSRQNNTVCQISASKYRPKNRRSVCGLPHFVDTDILTECGVTAISQIEYVPETPVKNTKSEWKDDNTCQDSSQSTLCLMRDMGILNKYDFMDYFKLNDRIRTFTANNSDWTPLSSLLMNVVTAIPLYEHYCSSPRRFMNVIDAMIMTCPISRRKNTTQCNKLFDDIIKTPPSEYRNVTKEQLDEILQEFHRTFSTTISPPRITRAMRYSIRSKHVFDYGILHSKNAPKDVLLDVKSSTKPPLILLPVYMRMNDTTNSIKHKDGILQPVLLFNSKLNITEKKTSEQK